MFGEVAFALSERPAPADYSNIKPALNHLSPTVPATFALAIGISLSVFMLPGMGVPGGPTPLLSAIGGAVGRVAADLSATANERASAPVGKAASSAQLVATQTELFMLQRGQAATKAHLVRRRARTGVVRRAPSTPVQVAAPGAPATPVTTRHFFSTPTTAKGKARGHGRALKKPTAEAPAPRAHGHGKALGRSSEHHHGLTPGHVKTPSASSPAPITPPKGNGGGNGHKGGKK